MHIIPGQCSYMKFNLVTNGFELTQTYPFEPMEGICSLSLYFYTSDIIETTVVQHIDFVAMVSAVGGSAGLFLGFSMVTCCFELCDVIMEKVFRKEISKSTQTIEELVHKPGLRSVTITKMK